MSCWKVIALLTCAELQLGYGVMLFLAKRLTLDQVERARRDNVIPGADS